jgi:hypothetical protein
MYISALKSGFLGESTEIGPQTMDFVGAHSILDFRF